jgi:L-ascorbate metabolism protein UlaG (beta-lactamase superfamily)
MTEQNRWYKQGDALLKEIEASQGGPGTAFIWFLGQLGFVLKMGDTVCYIDVLLTDLFDAEGRSFRHYPPPFAPENAAPDYFLCTHNHDDHLNLETLLPIAKASPRTQFVVPKPHRELLIQAGIEASRVLGAREGEALDLSGVSLVPVAAAHPDYDQDEAGDHRCLGYVLTGAGVRVYHTGDTMATVRLVAALKTLAPIDAAIVPINGGDWERTSRNIIGNMTVVDAVKLCRAISADLSIPAHYDMFRGNTENPAAFTDCFYALCPEKRHHVFALGNAT